MPPRARRVLLELEPDEASTLLVFLEHHLIYGTPEADKLVKVTNRLGNAMDRADG